MVKVSHLLTRHALTETLCHSNVATGAALTDRELLNAVRGMLKVASALEPSEFWSENYSEEEAEERATWAAELVAGFYERTSGDHRAE